jgi:hypothetical protein
LSCANVFYCKVQGVHEVQGFTRFKRGSRGVQEGSERFESLRKGARRFRTVRKPPEGFRGVQKGSEGLARFTEERD